MFTFRHCLYYILFILRLTGKIYNQIINFENVLNLDLNSPIVNLPEFENMYKRQDLQRVLKIKDFQNISVEQYAFSNFHSYANICQICFSHERDTGLKRCTKCKIIFYCSKEHQKIHWSTHKNFCKVATGLRVIYGGSHLFEKMKTENQQARIDLKNRLVDLIEAGLKRKLIPHEKSLIFFPKLCCVCYEADPKLLKFCTRCPHGNFCQEHYEDKSHLEYCNLFSYGLLLNAMGVTFKAGPIPGNY